MITCTERTLEGLEYLQDFYDITASELIKMLVAKEYQELTGNAIIIDQDELRTKFPKEKYKEICRIVLGE